MIDWHSHILPGMDDGSRNVAESISMLELQLSQGVHTVVATPHFYANDESVETFLERRQKSYELLKRELPQNSPKILLGSEVRYYQGICGMENLKSLRIEGSKILLLEMPMATWTEYMIRELSQLSSKSSFRIVLAHVERYLNLQKSSVWDRLYADGVLAQVNASYFTSLTSKRKAISFLRDGRINFVGSDCHNLTSRPPMLGMAFDIIQKKLGDDYIAQMNEYGYSMLPTEKKAN